MYGFCFVHAPRNCAHRPQTGMLAGCCGLQSHGTAAPHGCWNGTQWTEATVRCALEALTLTAVVTGFYVWDSCHLTISSHPHTCVVFGWWILRRMAISVRKSPSAISSERLSSFAATCSARREHRGGERVCISYQSVNVLMMCRASFPTGAGQQVSHTVPRYYTRHEQEKTQSQGHASVRKNI